MTTAVETRLTETMNDSEYTLELDRRYALRRRSWLGWLSVSS